MKMNGPQPFIPKDEEYNAAIADLCGEVARRLHNYPLWKQKLLQVLLQDSGASPDQVLELSGLVPQFNLDDDWRVAEDDTEGTSMAAAKPKAKAGFLLRYRPRAP